MISKVFYLDQLILDGKDKGQTLTYEDLILDEENPSKEIVIKVQNPVNEYLPFFYVRFAFTDSIRIKKISDKKFSRKFRVSLTTESGSYSISSDEDAYQDDFFVGVFYTENSEYIRSILDTDLFSKKFILIPRNVGPTEELEYIIRIELLDSSKHFFRKIYPNMDSYYQTFSRGYYQTLSNDYPEVGVLTQTENYSPVFSLNLLVGNLERAKNYFFSIYPLNGVKLRTSTALFDSYYYQMDNKLMNYVVTKQGNFVGTKFKMFFNYSNLLNSYVIDVSTFHEETTIWQYITDLVYLTLIEISKPLTFNSGFVPTNLQDASEKIASTYNYLLNALSGNSTIYEVVRSDGSFSTSSRILTQREKYDLYLLVFSWAKIYVSFLKQLNNLGIISIPSTTSNPIYYLDLYTKNSTNISVFLNSIKNASVFTFSENKHLNDLTIATMLAVYAYILTFDGRNIYFYPLEETFKFAASLFLEVSKNILVSSTSTEIDVNNYSQSTTTNYFSEDPHQDIIKQKLLAYTLADLLFSSQIEGLTESFFDYAMCDNGSICSDSKDKFKEAVIVDDDIVNLFNSYVELYSCNSFDTQNLIFVKDPNVCTSISNMYRNIDTEFFNFWVFLQNMNYKIKPTILQMKMALGMF
jgi:hypothetical protein